MTTKQRVIRYLIGVAIGTLLVYAMFPGRNWLSWTPQETLMKWVRESNTQVTDHAQCRMQCHALNNDSLQAARNAGYINLSKSDAQATPKRYHLEYGTTYYSILLADSSLTVIDCGRASASHNCSCP